MSTQQQIVGAHLVGSLATSSASETFTVTSEHLGTHLRRIPDGEVGKRFHWILFQGEVFENTSGLARIGEEPYLMAGFDVRPFMVDGTVDIEEIDFPELGYAEAAQESYAEFTKRRDEGVIAPGTRFQVSLPTPLAPITTFVAAEYRAALEPAYTRALAAEISKIVSTIPQQDLAIQFDLAVEFSYIETAQGRDVLIPSHAWFEPIIPQLASRAAEMIDLVPEAVDVGVHLCYGDVGEKHFVEPLDTSHLAEMANAITSATQRTLVWVHLPVPIERTDVEYFAPLKNLNDKFDELYLGLVHHEDGVTGAKKRIAAAVEAGIESFGVGTECGFGRGTSERTVPLLNIHADIAQPLPEHR